MRFEVRYPTGAPHEIELQGTVAVLGRDPSCDLVLNDTKCSRRHAVLEAGPQGIAIRDAGSANGTYVNGQKVERANLREGDVIRLGEVQITVLPEEMPGTVVMGPEDLADLGSDAPAPAPPPRPPAPAPPPAPPQPRLAAPPPRPAPPAARPAPVKEPTIDTIPPPSSGRHGTPAVGRPQPTPERPRPAARVDYGASGPIPRPLTVTVLGVLWVLSALLYAASGLGLMAGGGLKGASAGVALAATFFITMLSAVMAFGLFSLSPWARILQIVVAALPGVGLCGPYFVTCAAIIVYMLRPETKIQFSGRRDYRDLSPQEAETVRHGAPEGLFTGAILGGVVVAVILMAVLTFFAGPAGTVLLPSLARGRAAANEAAAIGRVRTVVSAEETFKGSTCRVGYADLDGLLHPAKVIPNYPAGGATFLGEDFAQGEANAYRFELAVDDPVAAAEGCPSRSFRRYQYSATPVDGRGRAFLATPDGVIHVANSRPATADDPPLN